MCILYYTFFLLFLCYFPCCCCCCCCCCTLCTSTAHPSKVGGTDGCAQALFVVVVFWEHIETRKLPGVQQNKFCLPVCIHLTKYHLHPRGEHRMFAGFTLHVYGIDFCNTAITYLYTNSYTYCVSNLHLISADSRSDNLTIDQLFSNFRQPTLLCFIVIWMTTSVYI